MKKYISGLTYLLLLAATLLCAQAQPVPQTPNLKLNVPPYGAPNWDAYVNQNFLMIDALQPQWRGTWATATPYSVSQMIIYGGGSYISLSSNNVGHQPDISPTFWQVLAGVGGVVVNQTSGVIPLATGAATIGAASHLDDGKTTPGTITSTEPFTGTSASFSGAVSGAQFNGAVNGNATSATTAATATHSLNLPADFATQSGAVPATGGFTSVTAQTVQADEIRSAVHWLDVRALGVKLNGTDDTPAWQAVAASMSSGGYQFQFPAGTSTITPGPSSGPASIIFNGQGALNLLLEGRGGDYQSVLQDSGANALAAPMIQIGNGLSANIPAGMDLSYFSLKGAPGTSFPNGQLTYNTVNLSSLNRVQLKQYAVDSTSTNGCSVGVANVISGSFPFFAEMRFTELSVNGTNTDTCNTGIKLQVPGGNVNFVNSNVENFTTGVNITGSNGTPVLTWIGGHFERIGYPNAGNRYYGGFAFKLDQIEPHIYGADVSSGMFWCGAGCVNGEITLSGNGTGWYSSPSDEGTGNRIHSASASPGHGQTIDTRGDEWFRVANNVVADPTFLNNVVGWAATNASLAAAPLKAPGALAGKAMLVTPTLAGGYGSQTFTVTPGTDYLVAALFAFTYADPNAQIQVYDNTSALLWDSGTISGPTGTPANVNGSSTAAWNFVKRLIPSGAATSFTVRVIAPSTTAVQMPALFIVPSIATQSNFVTNGTASCTGSGINFACSVAGRNNGAQVNNLTLTVPAPTYGSACFVRFHATVSASAVQPEVTIGAAGNTSPLGQFIYLVPGTSLDYNFYRGNCPTTIYVADFAGPLDENNMVISNLSVVPVYTQLVVPVTTPNDGLYLKAITPDGVQQRGNVIPTTMLYQNPSAYSLIGSGSVQTVQVTGNIGPLIAGAGIEWQLVGIRTAGAGLQNVTVAINGGANLMNCTFTNGVTSAAMFFKGYLQNVAGVVNSQVNATDTMSIGSGVNTTCGAATSIGSFANWSSPITLVFKWQAVSLNVNTGGTGCTTTTGLATTTSGSGSGMIVSITASGGILTAGAATTLGTGYAVGDTVTPTQGGCTGNYVVANTDRVTVNKFVVYQKQ